MYTYVYVCIYIYIQYALGIHRMPSFDYIFLLVDVLCFFDIMLRFPLQPLMASLAGDIPVHPSTFD